MTWVIVAGIDDRLCERAWVSSSERKSEPHERAIRRGAVGLTTLDKNLYALT
jgi:hypothetical protein